MNYYETLPHFFAYFLVSIALAIGFVVSYTYVTPHRELTLIRAGNQAVALQMVGTFLGFVLPLAVVIGNSVNLLDVAAWGVIALLTQLATFWVITLLFRDIEKSLTDNCIGSGLFLGGVSLGIGILQAGCMVP